MKQQIIEIDEFAMFKHLVTVADAYLKGKNKQLQAVSKAMGCTIHTADKWVTDAQRLGLIPGRKLSADSLAKAQENLSKLKNQALTNKEVRRIARVQRYIQNGQIVGHQKQQIRTSTEICLLQGALQERERITNLLTEIRNTWKKPVAFNYPKELDSLIQLIQKGQQ
jgi:hypothetical protein